MSERTDEDLMLAAAQGDVPAFEELAGRYRGSLVLHFERRVRNPQQAQDMAQDVLLKLWAARARYAPLGRTTHYLFTIARNHLFNRLDAMSRRPRGESLDSGDQSVFRELPRTASSEETALQAWTRAQVRKAIEELPADQREVVVLSRMEGLKYHEIAERLGVPVGTVEVSLGQQSQSAWGLPPRADQVSSLVQWSRHYSTWGPPRSRGELLAASGLSSLASDPSSPILRLRAPRPRTSWWSRRSALSLAA